MEQVSKQQPVNKTAFRVLVALSVTHCLNDSLQSVISAVYPLFKDDLALSFAQIGLITLVYQLSASVFQPITGLVFDKRPVAWSLPIGMSFTLVGLLNLAFFLYAPLGLDLRILDRYRVFGFASGSVPDHLASVGRA